MGENDCPSVLVSGGNHRSESASRAQLDVDRRGPAKGLLEKLLALGLRQISGPSLLGVASRGDHGKRPGRGETAWRQGIKTGFQKIDSPQITRFLSLEKSDAGSIVERPDNEGTTERKELLKAQCLTGLESRTRKKVLFFLP
jgi:hypothetical protein